MVSRLSRAPSIQTRTSRLREIYLSLIPPLRFVVASAFKLRSIPGGVNGDHFFARHWRRLN
jgi:hypothetical protein